MRLEDKHLTASCLLQIVSGLGLSIVWPGTLKTCPKATSVLFHVILS